MASAKGILPDSQGKPLDPKVAGPILESKENLFDHIRNVSRTQCVRDLVYCGGD
jgi:hypothetical protein